MRSFLIIRYLLISLIILCFSISFVSADDCAFQCWDDDGSCNVTECTSISSEESDTGYCKMCDLITCSAYCLGDNRENGITCNDNEQCSSGYCSGAKRAVYYQRACCPQESEWDYLKQACIDEQGNVVFQSEQEVGFNEEEYVEEYVNGNDDEENNNNNQYLELGGEDITETYDLYTETETDWPSDIDTTMSGATDPNEDTYDDIFNVERTKVKCDHNYNKKILKRSNKDKIWLVYKCKKFHILNLKQLEDISKRLGEQVTEVREKQLKSIDKGKGKIRKVLGCLWNGKNIKDKKTGKLYFVNNCEKYHYLDTETWLDKGIQYGAPDELYHTTVDYIQDGKEIPSTLACRYRGQNIRNKKTGGIFYISKHCKKRHYPNWETFKYYVDNILSHKEYIDLPSDTVKKIPKGKDIPKIKIKAKIKKQWKLRQKVDLGESEVTFIDIYNKGNVPLKYKIETQGSSWLGIFKNWKVINQGTWYTIKEDGHASIIVSLDARFIGTKGDYEDLIKVYTTDTDNEVKELPIKIEVEDFKRDAEEVSHNVYYPSGRNFAFPGEEITIQFNIKNKNKKKHPWVDECHDYGCESYGLRYTYGNNKVNWESNNQDELFIGTQINVKDTWKKQIAFTVPNVNSGEYTTEWTMFYYPKSRNRLDFGPKMFARINVEGQGIGGGWPEDVNIVPNADGFLTYPLESVDDNYVISGWFRNGGGSHSGIDYSPDNSGDYYVVAAADGVVSPTHYYTNYGNLISQYSSLGSCISSDPTAAYGNRIMIDHDNGYTTVYGHFEKDSILVSPGDPVTKGQRLGKMGNTGCSTGKHLHFEVRSGSTKIDPYGNKDTAVNYPDRMDPSKACGTSTKNLWTSCPPSLAGSEEEIIEDNPLKDKSDITSTPTRIFLLYNDHDWENQKNALLARLYTKYEQIEVTTIKLSDDFEADFKSFLENYGDTLSSGSNDVVYLVAHGDKMRVWSSEAGTSGITPSTYVKDIKEKRGSRYTMISDLPNLDKIEELVLLTCHNAQQRKIYLLQAGTDSMVIYGGWNVMQGFLHAGVDVVEATEKFLNYYKPRWYNSKPYTPEDIDDFNRYYFDEEGNIVTQYQTRIAEDYAVI